MALSKWQSFITDTAGNVLPFANISVFLYDAPGVPVIKGGADGAVPKSNPFQADANGYAFFYGLGGRYTIVAELNGVTLTWEDVQIGTAQSADIDLLSGDVIINGQPSGIRMLFSSSVTPSDPGVGNWRADDTVFANITELYIDDAQTDGQSIVNWLLALDDRGTAANRGAIRFTNVLDAQEWAEFRVWDTVVNSGGFRTITVTPLANAGWPFAAGAATGMTFVPTGIQGLTGTLTVGSVTTVTDGNPAAVTNVGTPENAILNFQLPAGPTGLKGDGLDFDLGPVANIAARDALVGVTPGQRVAVSDIGDGRSAVYQLVSSGPYVWSVPVYVTGLLDLVNDTTPQLGGVLDTNGKQVRFSRGADLASASTLTPGNDGNWFVVTGTTTINAIASKGMGTVIKLRFAGVMQLTYSSPNLILLTGANITTELGMEAEFVEHAVGQWAMTYCHRPSGKPLSPTALLRDTTNTIAVGYSVTPNNLGTMGSFTANPALGNYQYGTNNGAFTLTAPTSDCAIDIMVTNGASAGAITFSGFTAPAGGGGDTYATTNAQRFLLMIRRINGVSTYSWKAYQ